MARILLLMVMLPFAEVHAQYIIAGQHGPGDFYFDNADTTLTAIHNTNPWPVFLFDMDGNGTTDFDITCTNSGGLGGGGAGSMLSHGVNNNVTAAFGETDSCISFTGTLQYTAKMMRPFALNDTIGPGSAWDSTWTIAYMNFVMGNYSCSGNMFTNAPSPQYIGIRMINAVDTVYGWIRVSNVNAGSITIEEYAGNRSAVGLNEAEMHAVSVYPVPSADNFYFKTSAGAAELTIYNVSGEKVYYTAFKGSATINLPSGIYFYELISGNFLKKGKLIRL